MRLIESRTCVRFVERTNQIDFVEIINGNGCWSWLGRIGGRQELSMDNSGCFWGGIAAHEYLHALGFDHMHNDVRRDDYVDIFFDNIHPDLHFAFEKVDPRWFSSFNTPYDLRSVVHYPRWAFSTNGEDAIVPHDLSYIDVIGNGQLSDGDVVRINRMYQCMNV
jgi:Astacin (Peptidase family M12A)